MADGEVRQVIGTVVDIEFPADALPELHNAIEIDMDEKKLVAEVEQHLGNNLVRCLAMDSTDGLRRGTQAVDSGNAIQVPTGNGTLGIETQRLTRCCT